MSVASTPSSTLVSIILLRKYCANIALVSRLTNEDVKFVHSLMTVNLHLRVIRYITLSKADVLVHIATKSEHLWDVIASGGTKLITERAKKALGK